MDKRILNYNEIKWDENFSLSDESPSGLIHKVSRKRVKAGNCVGTPHHSKHWVVRFSGKNYQIHRIIWILLNGSIQDDLVVDHLDGDGLNNKIVNLALKTSRHNQQNQSIHCDNTSGVAGVCINRAGGKLNWAANWRGCDGKKIFRSFSCNKYGYDEAKELAVKCRTSNLLALNNQGQDYTERHIGSQFDTLESETK